MTDIKLVYITIENHSDALEMAQHLVKEDFVACVNILDKMTGNDMQSLRVFATMSLVGPC